jgi:hypothetical protein
MQALISAKLLKINDQKYFSIAISEHNCIMYCIICLFLKIRLVYSLFYDKNAQNYQFDCIYELKPLIIQCGDLETWNNYRLFLAKQEVSKIIYILYCVKYLYYGLRYLTYQGLMFAPQFL